MLDDETTLGELIAGDNSAVIKPLQKYLESIGAAIQKQLENHRRLHEALIADYKAKLDSTYDDLLQAAGRFAKLGWALPFSLTRQEITELADPSVSDDDIEQWFMSFYRDSEYANMRLIHDEIIDSPAVSTWRPLLTKAIRAIQEGAYLLSIPALLLIIEGLIAQEEGGLNSPFRAIIERVQARKRKAQVRSFDELTWISMEAVITDLYARSLFSNPRPHTLNRHWVLHGRDDVSNWQEIDAIRLVQTIHTLAH